MKKLFQFYIDDDDRERLRIKAFERRVSMAMIVRESVKKELGEVKDEN